MEILGENYGNCEKLANFYTQHYILCLVLKIRRIIGIGSGNLTYLVMLHKTRRHRQKVIRRAEYIRIAEFRQGSGKHNDLLGILHLDSIFKDR